MSLFLAISTVLSPFSLYAWFTLLLCAVVLFILWIYAVRRSAGSLSTLALARAVVGEPVCRIPAALQDLSSEPQGSILSIRSSAIGDEKDRFERHDVLSMSQAWSGMMFATTVFVIAILIYEIAVARLLFERNQELEMGHAQTLRIGPSKKLSNWSLLRSQLENKAWNRLAISVSELEKYTLEKRLDGYLGTFGKYMCITSACRLRAIVSTLLTSYVMFFFCFLSQLTFLVHIKTELSHGRIAAPSRIASIN